MESHHVICCPECPNGHSLICRDCPFHRKYTEDRSPNQADDECPNDNDFLDPLDEDEPEESERTT